MSFRHPAVNVSWQDTQPTPRDCRMTEKRTHAETTQCNKLKASARAILPVLTEQYGTTVCIVSQYLRSGRASLSHALFRCTFLNVHRTLLLPKSIVLDASWIVKLLQAAALLPVASWQCQAGPGHAFHSLTANSCTVGSAPLH